MRFSKFSSVYEVSSNNNFNYILRNNITNDNCLLSEQEFLQLRENMEKENPSGIINELKKIHVVVPNNYAEKKFIDYIISKYDLNKPDINIFYLTFNNECNLACKYCYVEGSYDADKKVIHMSDEIFIDTLEFIQNFIRHLKKNSKLSKRLSFIYYGSEPLLDRDKVKKSVEVIYNLCEELGIEREMQIITNATLIDDELVTHFKKYNLELAVSLDGPREINDSMRVFKKSEIGTFDKIENSIAKLNNAGVKFGISCTIGPHNINRLKENVAYFKKINAGGVGFNTLLEAKNKKIPILDINLSNDKLIEASEFANSLGFYEDRVQRKVKAFNKSEHPHFKDCGAVGNQLVFYPDGNIGICQAYLGCSNRPIVGNVSINKNNPLEILKGDTLKVWSKRHPINMNECVYCPAIGICGGGCVFNAEIKSGNLFSRDKSFCVHTHKILDWLLAKSIKEKLKAGNVYLKEMSFMFRQ